MRSFGKILLINSSPSLLENSASRKLANYFVSQWQARFPNYEIISRDIGGNNPIPHLTDQCMDLVSSSRSPVSPPHALRKLSDQMINELKISDIIVFAVPMHNYLIPSSLKAYLDLIIRADITFKYTDEGTEGLFKNKKVVVITTGGGGHNDTLRDFQAPYLKFILSYIGLNDFHFIRAHKLLWSEEHYLESIKNAEKEIINYISVMPIEEENNNNNMIIKKDSENNLNIRNNIQAVSSSVRITDTDNNDKMDNKEKSLNVSIQLASFGAFNSFVREEHRVDKEDNADSNYSYL
jgi:FMN-dependent NADH-azoreductase